MAKRIGITGNIGSGKSTVASIFSRLGIPIYSADQRAKRLMTESVELREAIIEEFGEAAYSTSPEGDLSLNRQYLAERVFHDPTALASLNALVHPAVAEDALRWHQEQATPYTLHEAAITFETGGDRALDAVIVVTAPAEVRLQRVMQRDDVKESDVRARMDKQWPEEKKIALADYLIDNSGDRLLLPQVLSVHRQLLNA